MSYFYKDLFDYAYWRDREAEWQKQKELKDKKELELYNLCVLNYSYLIELIDKVNFFFWSIVWFEDYGVCLPSCISFDNDKNDYVYFGHSEYTKYDYYGATFNQMNDFLEYEYNTIDRDIYSMCGRMWSSRKGKRKRVKKHILDMFKKGSCIFCTLTFDNINYDDVSPETRRKYVQRFLHRFNAYVCNIDYGDIGGREHYHAVVLCDKVDYTWWPYGNIDFKRVKQFKQDNECIASYLCKLTNHAVKTSTKNSRLLYSRIK